MSFTTAFYDGDSIIHFAPSARPAVKTRGKAAAQRTKAQAVTQPRQKLGKHRTRRGAIETLIGAIGNALRSLVLWIEEKSVQAHCRQVESYLAQSSNHADLERRIRELDHNSRLNWIDCGSR